MLEETAALSGIVLGSAAIGYFLPQLLDYLHAKRTLEVYSLTLGKGAAEAYAQIVSGSAKNLAENIFSYGEVRAANDYLQKIC